MPILTFSLNAEAQTPDGKTIPLPPKISLQQKGPLVQVGLTIEQSFAQALAQQGKTVPAPITGWALIDTGASVTCIDDAAATKLGLPVVDQVKMCSASHANTVQNVYPAQLAVAGLNFTFNLPKAMGATLEPQGIIALIGRDALSVCTLFYNGLTGETTISI